MPLRPRCEYAAAFPHSLPGSSCPPPREFPAHTLGGCAPLPAQIHQVSSRCRIKGVSHAGSSRTPLRPACRTRTIWQFWPVPALSGLLPPSPAPPGSGCPQLHRPAATGSAAKVSHLHSNHCASRRTHELRHSHKTWLIAAGIPEIAQARRLGHRLDERVVEVYSHIADEVETRIHTALKQAWLNARHTLANHPAPPPVTPRNGHVRRRLPNPTDTVKPSSTPST